MIKMKCIAKAPIQLHGYGDYAPGVEYSLPDVLAGELIATRDANWEEVKADGDPGAGAAGGNHSKDKRRK
jgi:hypothetical protein